MEKRLFFRAATAGLGKYHTGGYGRIGVYRVKGKGLSLGKGGNCDQTLKELWLS